MHLKRCFSQVDTLLTNKDMKKYSTSLVINKIQVKLQWSTISHPVGCGREKANPEIHMELQGGSNSQNNIEKDRQSWENHISPFQSLLQSYNDQDSDFFFCNQNKNRCWQGCGATGILHFAKGNIKGAVTIEKFGSSSIS